MRMTFLLLILCLLTGACKQKPIEPTTSKLPKLYTELIFAAMDSTKSDSNSIRTTLDGIEFSASEFEKVMTEAQENPELWIATLDTLLKMLDAEKAQEDSLQKKRPLFQNKTAVSLPTTD